MKQLLILAAILFAGHYLVKGTWEQKTIDQATTITSLQLPQRFTALPVGDRLYFSAAPGYLDLKGIQQKGILEVIRLNGDGKDAGSLLIEDEAELCDLQGMRFRYYNIDGGDSIETIVQHLEDGRVLVHCKHGAHRAPLVAGCYLLKQGITLPEVIQIIGWDRGEQPIYTDPRYAKYVNILHQWARRYSDGRQQAAAI